MPLPRPFPQWEGGPPRRLWRLRCRAYGAPTSRRYHYLRRSITGCLLVFGSLVTARPDGDTITKSCGGTLHKLRLKIMCPSSVQAE